MEKRKVNNSINYLRTVDNETSGNITITTGSNTIWLDPNYPYTPTITTPSYPIWYNYTNVETIYAIKVEKCENGFIVHKNGQKFVVTNAEDVAKYLKDDNGKR